jgi:predicted amidohydrolase
MSTTGGLVGADERAPYSRLMRVHVVQLGYGDDEPAADRGRRVVDLILGLDAADLVVLPELWAPGGFSYRVWAAQAEPVDGPLMTAIGQAAAKAGVAVHAGSLIEGIDGTAGADGTAADRGATGRGLWNTSVLFGPDGTRIATYRKIHRFGFGDGEPALLEAGTDIVTADIDAAGRGVRIGLRRPDAVAEPARRPQLGQHHQVGGVQAEDQVVVVVGPAAGPAARVEHWRLLGRARAIEDQVVMIQCNTAGTHAGVAMGGHSQVVAATGDVLAEAGEDEQVLTVDIDLEQVSAWRRQFPVLADRRL